jgi:hypothetical protein
MQSSILTMHLTLAPQFWSVWVPASLDDSQAVAVTMEQINRVWQMQQLYVPRANYLR